MERESILFRLCPFERRYFSTITRAHHVSDRRLRHGPPDGRRGRQRDEAPPRRGTVFRPGFVSRVSRDVAVDRSVRALRLPVPLRPTTTERGGCANATTDGGRRPTSSTANDDDATARAGSGRATGRHERALLPESVNDAFECTKRTHSSGSSRERERERERDLCNRKRTERNTRANAPVVFFEREKERGL